jgi:hypothetical protein
MFKYEQSLPPDEQRAEAWEELVEGTAVYTSVRLAELFEHGYKSQLNPPEPYRFSAFKNSRFFLDGFQKSLRTSTAHIYDILSRDYEYGCYQAILLGRYVPGWQKIFMEKTTSLYKELSGIFPVRKEDLDGYKRRFVEIYGADKIRVRCAAAMKKRDDAYAFLKNRRGTTYIVNLSRLGLNEREFFGNANVVSMGRVNMYLEGLPAIKIGNCEISSIPGPLVRDQLYFLKVVDANAKAGAKTYSVTFEKRDGDVYEGALIKTPLFTLKAPLVRIDETPSHIKFTVLPVLTKDKAVPVF